MEASASILIKRDRREVFEFIADPANQESWVEGVSGPEVTSEGEFGKGSTYESDYTYEGKTHHIRYQVTVYDPHRAFGVKSMEGPYPFHGLVTLEKDREGTFVTNTIDAHSDGVGTSIMFGVFGPLLRKNMSKQLRRELEALKAHLESDLA